MAAKKTKKTALKKPEKKTDAEILLEHLRSGFAAVEAKLDSVLSRIAGISLLIGTERDPDFKTHATVNKKFSIPQDRPPRERKMYKAVCAQCEKDCEVPFAPREDRPVYCRECFADRKKKGPSVNIPDREKIVAEISKTLNIDITSPAAPQKPRVSARKAGAAKNSGSKGHSSKTPKAKKSKK